MASDPTPIEPTSDENSNENAAAASAAATAAAAVSAAVGSAQEKAAETAAMVDDKRADEAALTSEFKQDVAEMQADASTPLKKGLGVRLTESMKANPVRSGVIIGAVVLIIASFFIPVPEPHVALGGEAINSQVPWWFTNSVLTTIVVDFVLILLALGVFFSQKMVPSGLQNVMEMIIEYFHNLCEQIAGKAAKSYFPWVMTIFLFVILSNYSGMIPGVGSIGWNQTHEDDHATTQEYLADRMPGQLAMADGKLVLLTPHKVAAAALQETATEQAATEQAATEQAAEGAESESHGTEHFIPLFRAPSADLNVTFALAITVMVLVQIYGFRALGFGYLQKFFTLRGEGMMKGINGFVGILELISEISRIVSFGFRLFGNIFAGEIVLATMAFLVAFILPVPFYVLELFVGFVQALVFAMLALVFFTLSTQGHGADHAHDEAPAHDEAHAGEPVAAAAH